MLNRLIICQKASMILSYGIHNFSAVICECHVHRVYFQQRPMALSSAPESARLLRLAGVTTPALIISSFFPSVTCRSKR